MILSFRNLCFKKAMRLCAFLGLAIFVFQISGCVKDEPQFPIEPSIELKSISDTVIGNGQTLKFVLSFKDGDGDFGVEDGTTAPPDSITDNCSFAKTKPEADSIFARIYRNPTLSVYYYVIRNGDSCLESLGTPFIPEKGKQKSIQGEITFETPGFACAPLKLQDTLQFGLLIKDRANNLSNYVRSPKVIILCQ
jgi:hypothetical protein